MTRSPSPRPPRRAALLAAAVLVTGTAATGSLLAAAPAAGAEPTTVSLTQSTLEATRPLCETAWTIERDDERLPTAMSRDLAMAVCLQLYRAETRLVDGAEPPAPDTAVPPLTPDGPAPTLFRVVVQATTTPSTTVTRPMPPSRTVTVPVPPPAAPAGAGAAAPAPAAAAGTGSAPVAAAGGAPVGAAPAPADTSTLIGGGVVPGGAAGVDPLTAGAPLPGDPLPADPLAVGAPLPGALPGAQPDAAAPGLDPLAGGAPVDTVGTPGTVSDPSTSTVAEAGPLDRDGGLSAALVAGVLGAVALLALLAREVAVHGVPRRIAAVLPRFGRAPEPAAGAASSDLTAGGFVDRWVHWGEAPGPGATGREDDLTDPVGFPPVPDDDGAGSTDPTGPIDLTGPVDPVGPGSDQAAPYSLTKRSSTTRATWPPGDPNG